VYIVYLQVRAFYEQLPDLWSLVPTVLLKDATAPRPSNETGSKPATDTAAAAAAGDQPGDSAAAAAEAAAGEAATVPAAADDSSDTPKAAAADGEDPATAAAAAAAPEVQGVDLILSRLHTCVSRDLCDELAVNFCYSNSKGARKRLVRALMDVPRGNLQLLPYYARVAATISQAYPEVGAGECL
jgi:regulator of nonsense transcripts 2